MAIAGITGPGDNDIVNRICSSVLLHVDTVTLLLKRLDAPATHKSSGHSDNVANLVLENICKVLLEHYRKVWLCNKPMKSSHNRRSSSARNEKASLISTKLSTLSEETAKLAVERVGAQSLAKDMVAEWAEPATANIGC